MNIEKNVIKLQSNHKKNLDGIDIIYKRTRKNLAKNTNRKKNNKIYIVQLFINIQRFYEQLYIMLF